MKRLMLMCLLGLVATSTGCGTIASQAYYGATGASGRYFEVKALEGPSALDRFQAVQVEAFDPSPMMGSIPSDVLAEVQPAVISRVTGMKLFTEVGERATAKPVLVVRGKFVDYDPGSSVVRAVYGANPTLTAQIELVDPSSRQVIGVAMVTGTVKSVVRAGRGELAQGMSKAVRGLLSAHISRKAAKEED
jgi:hypothetical protein